MSSIQQIALCKTHSYSRVQMRYSHARTLTGIVGVKSRLGRLRRRLLRLEDGVLSVFSASDHCSVPLMVVRVSSALSVTVDEKRQIIYVHLSRKARVSLSFRSDLRAFDEWATALQHAATLRLDVHYKLYGTISRGHYTKVYEAQDRKTLEKVAVKAISKTGHQAKAMYARREAEIARMVEHPNIVRTLDVFETDEELYTVMEFAQHGDLVAFLSKKNLPDGNRNNTMSEHNAKCVAQQLVSAIAYLHDMNVIHRNIKPENTLVFADGSIKLAGFGLARVLDSVTSQKNCLSSSHDTPTFYPPEVVPKTQFGKPVDIYGCGVVLYIALMATYPDSARPDLIFRDIRMGDIQFPPMPWAMISDDAKDFVRCLLAVNGKDRPTAHEAFQHPWLGFAGQLPGPTLFTPTPTPLQRNLSNRSEAASGGKHTRFRSMVGRNLTRFKSMVGRGSRSCRVNAGQAFCHAPSCSL